MTYGDRVREERKRRGWTRTQLATKIDSSTETIKRMENSDYPPRGSQFTDRIAHVLNLRCDEPDREPAAPPPDLRSTPDAQLIAQLTAVAAELSARLAAGRLGEAVAPSVGASSDEADTVPTPGERLVTVRRSDLGRATDWRQTGLHHEDRAAEGRSPR